MLFALNYSPQAAELLSQGKIAIDRFKCPDWTDLIAVASAYHPVYVHFPLIAGNESLGKVDWRKVETLLAQTDTPYVNLHLMVPATVNDREIGLQRMMDDVRRVVERFGSERVIVENIPYQRAVGKYAPICAEPEAVQAVLAQTGVRFLLDISHARIAAESFGMDEQTYIEQLPLDRLSELHVTGIHDLNGVTTDHLAMKDDDWAMFDWVMDKIRRGDAARPWCVSFEYGGITPAFDWRSDPNVIASQTPRLYAAVHE